MIKNYKGVSTILTTVNSDGSRYLLNLDELKEEFTESTSDLHKADGHKPGDSLYFISGTSSQGTDHFSFLSHAKAITYNLINGLNDIWGARGESDGTRCIYGGGFTGADAATFEAGGYQFGWTDYNVTQEAYSALNAATTSTVYTMQLVESSNAVEVSGSLGAPHGHTATSNGTELLFYGGGYANGYTTGLNRNGKRAFNSPSISISFEVTGSPCHASTGSNGSHAFIHGGKSSPYVSDYQNRYFIGGTPQNPIYAYRYSTSRTKISFASKSDITGFGSMSFSYSGGASASNDSEILSSGGEVVSNTASYSLLFAGYSDIEKFSMEDSSVANYWGMMTQQKRHLSASSNGDVVIWGTGIGGGSQGQSPSYARRRIDKSSFASISNSTHFETLSDYKWGHFSCSGF